MTRGTLPARTKPGVSSGDRLLGDLRSLIGDAREQVARAVNAGLVGLYWQIGRRIRQDILHEERAAYGEVILQTLSAKLTAEYGRGFTRSNLSRMVSFAERFSDEQIVATLSQQLSWSHFVEIIPIDDSLKRDFYAELCRVERWSVRTLRQKVDRLLEKKLHDSIRLARERLTEQHAKRRSAKRLLSPPRPNRQVTRTQTRQRRSP